MFMFGRLRQLSTGAGARLVQSRRPVRIPGNIDGGCTACGNNCKCTVCTCACDGACDSDQASGHVVQTPLVLLHSAACCAAWARILTCRFVVPTSTCSGTSCIFAPGVAWHAYEQ